MKVLTLFEKVNREKQISQPDFLTYYNDTVSEIVNLYGEPLTLDGNPLEICESLYEEMCIDDAYADSVTDNILYLADTSNSARKSEFLRKSKNAFNRLWSRRARNLKFRRRRM